MLNIFSLVTRELGDKLDGSPGEQIIIAQQYKAGYKREATKGIDGFSVEAIKVDRDKALEDAEYMYQRAKELTTGIIETKCGD